MRNTNWPAATRRVGVLAFLAIAATPAGAAAQNALFAPTGSLNDGRFFHTATVLPGGRVLIAGGSYVGEEVYDPASGVFTRTGNLSVPRFQHTATLLPNGKVLIAGGRDVFGSGMPSTASAELYDPTTGTFTTTGSMNSPRHFHTATLLPNGKVLVAGGLSWGTHLATAELYDPEAGTFTSTGNSMSVARSNHTATLLPNGKVLIAGGEITGPDGYSTSTASAETYDPTDRRGGTFRPTGSLNAIRARLTATLLPNGKVLIAGGSGANPIPGYAELYDPSAGTFGITGSLGALREAHTATLLPNGKVLIAGGRVFGFYGSGPDPTAELYDPTTGTFAATANNMSIARAWFTATLLPTNGKVLMAAGYPAIDSSGTASADLYGDLQACY